MNRFELELKNNNFICSECLRCKKLVWPPSDYCDKCFGNVTWRQISKIAILLEYSYKGNECFGIVELEGQIRVIGAIQSSSKLQIGQQLILKKCDYDGKAKFVFELQEDTKSI